MKLDRIRSFFNTATYWPSIDSQIGEYVKYLKGRVLNAGAGDRDISHLVEGELYNQDIPTGIHNKNIHIYSPLHEIPVEDDFFDAIVCNAVLEHVEDPLRVMREFYRVMKKGGYLYLAVPFLQPEHLDPTDFQRFTKDGLQRIVETNHFEVVTIEGFLNVYHTVSWIMQEWLTSKQSVFYRALRYLIFPILRYQCKHSNAYVHRISSAYRVLARKA
jgi:SAM-dependent methyltransferase